MLETTEKVTGAFANRLDGLCRICVKEAERNDTAIRGRALIAPGNHHLLLKHSSARYYAGPNAVAIILTGMGDDGARGMLERKQAGAATIAHDEATSIVFGMPNEATKRGAVDRVMALPQIPGAILAAA